MHTAASQGCQRAANVIERSIVVAPFPASLEFPVASLGVLAAATSSGLLPRAAVTSTTRSFEDDIEEEEEAAEDTDGGGAQGPQLSRR